MVTKARSKKVVHEPTVSRPELLVGGSDEAFRQFLHDTLAFAARLQEIRNQIGQVIGLSGTQYTVLIAIAHLSGNEEKVGVNLVADHLHFSGAFITIEINKLVAAGLVEKATDAEDRRRVVLTITAKARALLNELAPVQRPANDMLFSCLSANDFKKLRKVMSDLVRTADQSIRLLDYTSPALQAGSPRQ
ncbi:MarR family winged helix-turn-helix transcriptional regulator [Bradyrhizobium sp. dw_78]|uniref:MarR family winged helix-turn-helix transcriptional regulator n=1 Tax=Bradyrhizobium sp. dw_78 TaxID=2719793 RepID=UPI001BD2DD92|nr:MarR family winged helix-turn-helix transcriptional regulator [Bradyrhizobium sp. dw_78]